MSYDVEQIRSQFPTLHQELNGKPLVYLDSAASAQKPECVIARVQHFYRQENAAVHRGIHHLSAQATELMEQVRDKVKGFLNAKYREEIVFVRGATQAINLIANSYGRCHFKSGDEVIITEMEHHANIVPWQMLAQELSIKLVIWPIEDDGTLDLGRLRSLFTNKTRLLALTHVSNVLGTINPIKDIIQLAKDHETKVLVDGAQAVMHQAIDVQDLDCDFYLFSGHKLYAPTGIGVLFAKLEHLETMPPWEGGGAMITDVDLVEGTRFNAPPWRFEAGTPNVAGIIGLGEAINFIEQVGFEGIQKHEEQLMDYALKQLADVPDIFIYGPEHKSGVISFNLGSLHAFDVGSFLDKYGVAIRTGHHCAMPLMKHYNVPGMCRMSVAMYTNQDDIDALVSGLHRIHTLLAA